MNSQQEELENINRASSNGQAENTALQRMYCNSTERLLHTEILKLEAKLDKILKLLEDK